MMLFAIPRSRNFPLPSRESPVFPSPATRAREKKSLPHLHLKRLRSVITKNIHHLDQHSICARLFIDVWVARQRECPVLPCAVGDPALHEGVVLKVPVYRPVVDVVGPL